MAHHPARSGRVEVGLGPIGLPGFASIPIEDRHVREAREDLIDRRLAHLAAEALSFDEREDRHEIVLAGAEIAPAQVGHRLVGQTHVRDQILGQPVIGGRITPGQEIAPVQHDPAIGRIAGLLGGRHERSSRLVLHRIDLAPSPEPPDVVLDRLEDVVEQDVVLDRLVLELLEQRAALRVELEYHQGDHHEHQGHQPGRGDQRVSAKRHGPVAARSIRAF